MIEMLKDLCYHPGSCSGETFQKEKRTGPLGVTLCGDTNKLGFQYQNP